MKLKIKLVQISIPHLALFAMLIFSFLVSSVILAQTTSAATTCSNIGLSKAKVKECESKVNKACKDQLQGREACIQREANKFKANNSDEDQSFFDPQKEGSNRDQCGKGESAVKTKFNFGCVGDRGPDGMGPIEDLAYALVRFLSAGVGIVLVISMIVAGIQYSSSEGSAETTQAAKKRIQDTVIGLVIYLFAFALVQYLVPGGLFNSSMMPPQPTILLIGGVN